MKMKESKINIVFIILVIFTFIVISGGLYYVSTRISPKEIGKITMRQLHQIFPHAVVELGNVSANFGTSMKFKLDKLKIYVKHRNNLVDLFKVDRLDIKISLWSIMTKRGNIEVKLHSPQFNYVEFNKGSNWQLAVVGSAGNINDKSETKKDQGRFQFRIPSFLTTNRFNFRLNNTSINYRFRKKDLESFFIKKFIVNNFSFKDTTAFELDSEITLNKSKKNELSFKLQLIGQLSLKELMDKEQISSIIIVKLNNLAFRGLKKKISEIKSNVKMTISNSGEIFGTVESRYLGRNRANVSYHIDSKTTNISKINFEIFTKDILEIFNYDDNFVDGKNSIFNINGKIVIDYSKINKRAHIIPQLDFSITPGIFYKHKQITGFSSFNGSYNGNNIEMFVNNKLLQGNVDLFLKGVYDINSKFALENFGPFKLDINLTDMKLSKDFIQDYLYSKKKKSKNNKTDANKISSLPAGEIALRWDRIKIDKDLFKGSGDFLISNNQIVTDNLRFRLSKGKGKLKYSGSFIDGKFFNKVVLSLKKLDLKLFKIFLPPSQNLNILDGLVSGKVAGNIGIFPDDIIKYHINTKCDVSNGKLKSVKVEEYFSKILSKILLKFNHRTIDNLKFDRSFKKIKLQSVFTEKKCLFKRINFLNKDNEVVISGNGVIYTKNQVAPEVSKSIINLTYRDNIGNISRLLFKYPKNKKIPLRLEGIGFGLTPNYKYTLQKLSNLNLRDSVKKSLDENTK